MYGLLGEHLPHSFSPQIHLSLGNEDYHLFEIAPEKLEGFLTEKSLRVSMLQFHIKKQ